MRIKRPEVRNKGTMFESIQCSHSEVGWHVNPIKKWLYLNLFNRINKFLFYRYQFEIEL